MEINLALKEIFLYNFFESICIISLLLINTGITISKKKFVYHVLMLSISNYIFSSLTPYAVIMQILYIILLGWYFGVLFKINIISTTLKIFKYFIIIMIFEVSYAIIFNLLFNIEVISMVNDENKFPYVVPCYVIEILLLYIYHERREILMEKLMKVLANGKKMFIGFIKRR